MRVITGTAKGTKLFSLEGIETRPTLDRVKEALFSSLQFKLKDATVLDLFAGSGALGIEALSRGAKHATFVDSSFEAIKVIKKNIEKTKMQEVSTIYNKNFLSALKFLNEQKFDIIFLDPPYNTNFVLQSIEQIIKFNLLTIDGIIIIETDLDDLEENIKNIKNINIVDSRKYGRVKLIFLNRKG